MATRPASKSAAGDKPPGAASPGDGPPRPPEKPAKTLQNLPASMQAERKNSTASPPPLPSEPPPSTANGAAATEPVATPVRRPAASSSGSATGTGTPPAKRPVSVLGKAPPLPTMPVPGGEDGDAPADPPARTIAAQQGAGRGMTRSMSLGGGNTKTAVGGLAAQETRRPSFTVEDNNGANGTLRKAPPSLPPKNKPASGSNPDLPSAAALAGVDSPSSSPGTPTSKPKPIVTPKPAAGTATPTGGSPTGSPTGGLATPATNPAVAKRPNRVSMPPPPKADSLESPPTPTTTASPGRSPGTLTLPGTSPQPKTPSRNSMLPGTAPKPVGKTPPILPPKAPKPVYVPLDTSKLEGKDFVDEETKSKDKIVQKIECEWTPETAGGCLNYGSVVRNPQFTVTVTTSTHISVTLKQEEDTAYVAAGCMLALNSGQRITHKMSVKSIVGGGQHFVEKADVLCIDMVLQPKSGRPEVFTLMPCTFKPAQMCSFALVVVTDQPITITELPPATTAEADSDSDSDTEAAGAAASALSPPPMRRAMSMSGQNVERIAAASIDSERSRSRTATLESRLALSPQDAREHAFAELISSEEAYAINLSRLITTVVDVVSARLGTPDPLLATKAEVDEIFGNVKTVLTFSQNMLLPQLYARYEVEPLRSIPLSDIFSKLLIPLRKIYSAYVSNYSDRLVRFSETCASNQKFREFCEAVRQMQQSDVPSYLILPIKRLPAYESCIREILNRTDEASYPDWSNLRAVVDDMSSIGVEINSAITRAEGAKKLFEIMERFVGSSVDITKHGRLYLRESRCVIAADGGKAKKCMLYLFNDSLMYCTIKPQDKLKYQALQLLSKGVLTRDKGADLEIEMDSGSVSWLVTFEQPGDRDAWKNAIVSAANEQRLIAAGQAPAAAAAAGAAATEGSHPLDRADITYMPEEPGKPPALYPDIKTASFERLVERLTHEDHTDLAFQRSFMLSYRAFTTPKGLLSALRDRFDARPAPGLSNAEIDNFNGSQRSVRLRVANVLKGWLNTNHRDFATDPELVELLTDFLANSMQASGMETMAQSLATLFNRNVSLVTSGTGLVRIAVALRDGLGDLISTHQFVPTPGAPATNSRKSFYGKDAIDWLVLNLPDLRDKPPPLARHSAVMILEKMMEEKLLRCVAEKTNFEDGPVLYRLLNPHLRDAPPPPPDMMPILPKKLYSFSFLDLHPKEVARQMTLIDSSIYSAIEPKEFLGQAWTRPNKLQIAPNITEFIQRFNMTGSWVATEIVSCAKLDDRKKMIRRFLQIAMELKELNNFNGCQSIMAGLGNSAIARLKKTWDKLDKKDLAAREELLEFFSPTGNFRELRKILTMITPPCVPYIGTYLTDLVFIEDGKKNITDAGLINFDKHRKVSTVVEIILAFQSDQYSIHEIPQIGSFLEEVPTMSDAELYNKSLEVEPRDKQRNSVVGATGSLRKGSVAPNLTGDD